MVSTWINLLKLLPLRLEFHKQFMNGEVRMTTDPVPTEALLGKISWRPASVKEMFILNIVSVMSVRKSFK